MNHFLPFAAEFDAASGKTIAKISINRALLKEILIKFQNFITKGKLNWQMS